KFKEHYWFHSVPYYSQSPSDLEWPEYNKLGSNASAGCVRMCVRDVKWVYDNISLGTVIRVYASSAAEPMAKPASIRIDTSDSNPNRGWDPTDPDPGNPYV
ncbi:MAG: L,D-transpeptidase, partial [Eubacteriales bacterium]